jgi:hypothetical protein
MRSGSTWSDWHAQSLSVSGLNFQTDPSVSCLKFQLQCRWATEPRPWTDRWLDGGSVQSVAPLVAVVVLPPRVRKFWLVADVVQSVRWIRDISGSLSIPALAQYVSMWSRVHGLQPAGEPDRFIWKWSSNQQYLAASTYKAFFLGQCSIPGPKSLPR